MPFMDYFFGRKRHATEIIDSVVILYEKIVVPSLESYFVMAVDSLSLSIFPHLFCTSNLEFFYKFYS